MKKKNTAVLILTLLIVMAILPASGNENFERSELEEQHLIDNQEIAPTTGNDVDWWPMFHHDLQLTGYTTSSAPSTNKVLWTDGSLEDFWDDPQRSAPAIVDGKLYIGATRTAYPLTVTPYARTNVHNDHVHNRKLSFIDNIQNKVISSLRWSEAFMQCMDAGTGEEIWKTFLPGEYFVWGSAAVADGQVYITTTESYSSTHGHLYCLDALTGDIQWNFTLEHWDWVSPVVSNGKVYVAGMVIYEWPNTDCKLYCLDAVTGDEIYNATLGKGSPVDSPALDSDRIYISVYDRAAMETYLYCVNTLNGNVLWQKNLLGDVFGSSPVIYDDTVIASSSFLLDEYNISGVLWCLDAVTGDEQWNYSTDNVFNAWTTPAVAYGKVYFASSHNWDGTDKDGFGEIRCLNASSGELIWNKTLGDFLYSSPAIADGKVYINSLNYWEGHGDVFCLDPIDGSIIWQYWLWSGSYSSPAIANSSLYIAAPFCMYAFDDSAPSNNPPVTTITGPTKGKVGREYNYTIFADDPEGGDLAFIFEFSDGLPGFYFWIGSSGEPVTFTRTWEQGDYFIRGRAQDDHYAWSDWEILSINITEILLQPTFLIGLINTTEVDGNMSYITIEHVLSVRFFPFDIRVLSSGEEIVISNDYIGYVSSRFIIGRFKADLD